MALESTEKSTDKPTGDKSEKSLRFLIACLKHTCDGKTDWDAVIDEEKIVSVGAAKKRFTRMLAPYGVTERSLTGFGGRARKGKKEGEEDVIKKEKGSPKKRKITDMKTVGEEEVAQ